MLSKFIYFLLRFISWVGVSVFYRRTVLGKENLRFSGPAIVVSNHPSTLMDPLNVGIRIRQEMYFLANYGLFKNPVLGWVLTRLFCIPVKRKEDVAEGEARNNDAAFEASFQNLERGRVLYVAAEGVSWMNRFVRPFKTGTARIAFGAERRNDWGLGVKIIPVGLSYPTPNFFRSRVTVEYGTPIDPQQWAAAELADHEAAVDNFTTAIQQQVSALTIDSGSESGDEFVNQLEGLLRNSPRAQVWSEGERHQFLKKMVTTHRDNEPLKAQISAYSTALQAAGLNAAGVANPSLIPHSSLIILPGFPFFLVGYAFWALPCYLPWLLAKRLGLYVGYDSNVKMLAGFFTFPLALWGARKIAFWLSGNALLSWAVLAVLIGLGYFADYYLRVFQAWRAQQKAVFFQKEHPEAWAMLRKKQEEVLQAIGLS